MTDYRDHPMTFEQLRSDEEEFDLMEYVHTVWGRKWSILGLTLLAAAWGSFVAYSAVPIYQSTTTLMIEPERKNVINIQDLYDMRAGGRRFMETQIAILQSRSLVEEVMRRLGMWEEVAAPSPAEELIPLTEELEPEVEPEARGETDLRVLWQALRGINLEAWYQQQLVGLGLAPAPRKGPEPEEIRRIAQVNGFRGRLSIRPEESGIITISYRSPDRVLAARVANTVAEVYIESELEARLVATQQASGWLFERIGGLREKLRESEEALQDYREREELFAGGDGTMLQQQTLQSLSAELNAAEKARSDLRLSIEQVRAASDLPLERMNTLSVIRADQRFSTLLQNEMEARRNLEELSRRYGPRHPTMVQAEADLAQAKENTRNRLDIVVDGLGEEFKIATARVNELRRQINAINREIQEISRKGHELSILEREVEVNRQLYDQFLSRFKETRETDGLERINARIVDRALPALGPIHPNKQRIMMMWAMIGLAIGVMLAFLLKFLDKTLQRSADLESRLGLPPLGTLPQLRLNPRKQETPLDYLRDNKSSFFAESIRTLRTGVVLSGLDNPKKIIIITSTLPGEGKSTVAMNLAHSLSEMDKGKVLLIDADMRRPTIAKHWGLAKDSKGLSEFVSESAKLAECLHSIEKSKLYVMPAGIIPPNPLEILSSKRFATCLESLQDGFNHIIIDSAPTMAVSDALVLSTYASGVIYVVKAMTTPYPLAKEGLKRLRHTNAHLIGGVLNCMPMPGEGYGKYYRGKYFGYYHKEYYGSYGYSNGSEARGKS